MIQITEATSHNNPYFTKVGSVDVTLHFAKNADNDQVFIVGVSLNDIDMTRAALRNASENLFTYEDEVYDDDQDPIDDIVPLNTLKSLLVKTVQRRPSSE